MNFLFHMFLSFDDPEILVGNFLGDFIKGRPGDRYPPRIRTGILLHRKIDSFAQKEPFFSRSRRRLDPRYGLYRGVLVDLFYDHFLAGGWGDFSDVPLGEFLDRSRGMVERHLGGLPESPRLTPLIPVIFDDLIPSYGAVDGIGAALRRMSRRIKRANPLAGAEDELLSHYDGLEEDFRGFVPKALAFSRDALSTLEKV